MTDDPHPPTHKAEPPYRRIASGLLLAGLLGVAVWQKACGGIQIELIVLGLLLGPLGLVGALPSAGAASRSWAPLVLGALALGAVRSGSVWEWGLCAAAAAGVASARSLRAERELPGGPALVWLALLGAGAISIAAWAQGQFASTLKLGLLAPLYWEATARWRSRSSTSRLRRVACGWTVVLANVPELVRGSSWEASFPVSAGIVAALGVAWVALVRGLGEVERSERRKVQRRILRLVSPFVAVASLYLCGELILHVVPNTYARRVLPSPENTFHMPGGRASYLGWYYSEPEFDEPVSIRWNAQGWFDDEHTLENPEGARRLLVVGDSYVEAIQVSLDDHYHQRVERLLAAETDEPVEAIAYGWSGWGQLDELEALTVGVSDGATRNLPDYPPGLAYEPELVVLEILP
ncbi:MAG: hypothetical protein R3F62_16410, partial [Planctomycetota bacterium]